MKPKYTLDLTTAPGRTVGAIRLNIPIRWDNQGNPTFYERKIVPFCETGTKRMGDVILHRCRILTDHVFFDEQ
jgi:hypothetical protein